MRFIYMILATFVVHGNILLLSIIKAFLFQRHCWWLFRSTDHCNNEMISTAIATDSIDLHFQQSIVCVITSMDRCGAQFSHGGWCAEVFRFVPSTHWGRDKMGAVFHCVHAGDNRRANVKITCQAECCVKVFMTNGRSSFKWITCSHPYHVYKRHGVCFVLYALILR